MITDEIVLQYLWPNKIPLLNRYKDNISEDILNYLTNRYIDSESLNETLYRIKHNIEHKPTCPICGNPLLFINKKGGKYKKTCGYKCSNSNPDKIKLTQSILKEKYGVTNAYNIPEVVNKYKKRNLELYNVEFNTQRKDVKDKINKTWKSHTEEYNKLIKEKTKQTCLKKYGVENPFQSIDIQNKYKKTCLERYGETSHMKTDKYKQMFSNIISSNEIQNKINNTKKKNKSFNKSELEDKTYSILKEKYPDVIRQYRSNVYPFNCDFYVPSKDLYIECHYHWTHGGKLFEGTKEDILKLEYWKSKNTDYYNEAIKTWTIRDINKRKVAQENNLNYIIVYNINELL